MTLSRRRSSSLPASTLPVPGPASASATTDVCTDICAGLFDVCRQCQRTHLDALGATCMFDVEGGQVPSWMFEMLKAVVEMVMADIAACAFTGGDRYVPAAAVGITLRRSGAFWALAIAENLSGKAGERRAARRLTMVRALTDRLDCVCRTLPNAWGSTIAIAFPIRDAAAGHAVAPPILH